MKVYSEISLRDFKPWSGAVSTYNRIEMEGKLDDLEFILEDLYPDGVDETTINDLLWFDEDTVYEWLGIRSEQQIRDELRDKYDELEDLESDLEFGYNQIGETFSDPDAMLDARIELYNRDYKEDMESLTEEIAALEEELEAIAG